MLVPLTKLRRGGAYRVLLVLALLLSRVVAPGLRLETYQGVAVCQDCLQKPGLSRCYYLLL
jgi:hypothetical protein